MDKPKKMRKKATGTMNADGKIPESGSKSVTDTGVPKNSVSAKEEKKSLARKVKYELINEEKSVNKAIEKERNEAAKKRNELKKLCEETNSVAWHQKTKREKAVEKIIEEGAITGIKLSEADARMIYREMNSMSKITDSSQSVFYFNSLEKRVGRHDMCIILMAAGIILTLAKCPMPENARAYQIKAKALVKAQTDNTYGFFTPAFAGLTVMGGLVDDLLTAIENFEDKDGTGNIETVNGLIDDVQVQVDALLVYVNGKCRANQLAALEIIAAAEMVPVKKKEKGKKKDFGIKLGAASGSVILTSLAGTFDEKRVPTTYYWQYGLMVGTELIWYDLPDTVDECTTTATGMPINVTVAFRKRTKSKKGGLSAWCTPLYISPK